MTMTEQNDLDEIEIEAMEQAWISQYGCIPLRFARLISEVKRRRLEQAWLPIEGAPKDRTVDLWSTTRARVPNCRFLGAGWWDDSHYTNRVTDATHYRLLPPPPPGTGG